MPPKSTDQPVSAKTQSASKSTAGGSHQNGKTPTTGQQDINGKGPATAIAQSLRTALAQKSTLLTKSKPEGIQISRSKHWKFISSYHGPWLQLPPELLTQLAYVNESSRPPLQISPTIFSTVLQIRTLVDEATHLAVRAHNPASGPHGTAKISRERQFRMFELAVEKLAKAYALDEVAASVASMQSASAVEEVAGKVIEKAKARGEEPSRDARYVYFFCEKIPSRMLSESTSLIPLTQLHQESPAAPHYLRTRAITQSLKGDYLPAIKDLTAALSLVKVLSEHQSQSDDKGKSKQTSNDVGISPDIESQCVFQRGGCYLTLAIRHASRLTKAMKNPAQPDSEEFKQAETDIRLLRTYARKAERDFLRFLSKVDYASDIDREEDPIVVPLSTIFSPDPEDEQGALSPLELIISKGALPKKGEVPDAALTYHPLLPDALYSLLLARTLTLTPPHVLNPAGTPDASTLDLRERERGELVRWAFAVARLQTICDGYPLFLPARSPARADWIELLRLSGQTLLKVSNWESFLSALPKPITKKSVLPTLRDLSLSSDAKASAPLNLPKSDYPVTTERATVVSTFVEEVVYGQGVVWDLNIANEEVKGRKKKGKK